LQVIFYLYSLRAGKRAEKYMDTAIPTQETQWETDPRWFHALTLTERLALHLPPTHTTQETARQCLTRWKEQGSFKVRDLFAQRLSFDQITEEDLISLLNEPIETIQQNYTHETMPSWLRDLTAALATDIPISATTLSPFVLPFQPLLAIGINKIETGIQELSRTTATLPFEPATIFPLLIMGITQRIEQAISKPLILELNIARLQKQLAGDSGEERIADFLRQLSQRERLRAFLLDYPVLARYLVTIIDHWASYSLELLQHLCLDWHDICITFTPGTDPGHLQEIQHTGDHHNKGRSVLLLRFANGLRLVYKPRPLSLDKHFQELLVWINAHSISHQLRPINIIDRDSYGWCEFVTAQDCDTKEAIERFYERIGSYLAIFYLLDATDFHAENLLAAGEHPIPIDLESLFHPRLFKETNSTNGGLLSSVLRIGLLPTRDLSGKSRPGTDISGIAGGQKGQLTSMQIPVVRNGGTDQMHVGHDYIEIPMSHNQPMLNGEYVEVQHYTENIVHGFAETYHLFVAQQAELRNDLLPRFARDEIRLIARPTQITCKRACIPITCKTL
jgi:type 2 lantibiotic biosynthesis protein LanM